MDSSSINIIIGGIIGVSGALLGSITNGIANYKNAQIQAQREQNKFHLSKLEELFELILGYSHSAYWFRARIQEYSKNEPTSTQLNELVELLTKQINKTTTTVCFYAPSLVEDIKEINILVMDLQTFGLNVLSKQTNEFEELLKIHLVISEKVDALLLNIQDLSKEYTGLTKADRQIKQKDE